ncbi:DUF5004 domain-containing protein [Maribacter sp. X9]|uniref:DUF5004 domain-containing protein n=1 Tax=Maribacter sp. X9 TaxID=3402159 RepID=UPI003AF3610B
MKNSLFLFLSIIFFACSSDKTTTDEPKTIDSIVGIWTELGRGDVLDDGTDQFSEYNYFCATLGRYSFEADGTFRIETFDGPDDNCSSTGVLTGKWENTEERYLISVVTDTSNESAAGQESNIEIEFPTDSLMQWIFQVDSPSIDYEYELFTRVE